MATVRFFTFKEWAANNEQLKQELSARAEVGKLECCECEGRGKVYVDCDGCGHRHWHRCTTCYGTGVGDPERELRRIYEEQLEKDKERLMQYGVQLTATQNATDKGELHDSA